MAPPTRLRPHLDDLLQKNLELEHIVADLRHQLTQSSAKWADERKMLATGCDALMASFAKYRARLDGHPSGWEDSEGEVEHNLVARGQSEGTGEVENVALGPEGDSTNQGSTAVDDLRERCHTLTTELQVKEEELEESRRKREAAEEELQRVQRSLEARSEQLRTTLASAKADTSNGFSPARVLTPDDASTQTPPSKPASHETLQKLNQANTDVTRLKQLLLQWQKYGSDWKQSAHAAQSRASELEQRETALTAQIKAAEESATLLENEKNEVQRLTSALADQTAAAEQYRSTCEDSAKRVHDLEAMVALLRAQLSPERLTSFDSGQDKAASEPGPPNRTESPMPRADPNPNKRNDMIMLKIPSRAKPSVTITNENKSARKPPAENNTSRDEQFSQVPATISIPVAQGPQITNGHPSYTANEVDMCIHTCNSQPCRNESHSFLWPRKQASLPRHALSGNKHRNCTPTCPGHRLLSLPVTAAMKEPRSSKCRPPSEAELALAAEEAKRGSSSDRVNEETGATAEREGANRSEGSGEPEETDEPDTGSTRGADKVWEPWRKIPPWIDPSHSPQPLKRPRLSLMEEGSKRVKKRRSRPSKP